jgi:ATP-dependent exoDNAse (exonuclease V) beta subunit
MSSLIAPAPPDLAARNTALDPSRSVLVQAPAGSGKTDLLTRRFLRLLSEVDDPGQIVAITFTKAAAAEMRQRILSELEKAEAKDSLPLSADPFSMEALAHRALERSHAMGWQLLDLSARLQISTIDSFCCNLALQQPLLSSVGGSLDINEYPSDLYRRAARLTLERLGDPGDASLDADISALLLWRDNNWHEMESLLAEMLSQRDRWMQNFVLDREPNWDELRSQLERPFARAIATELLGLNELLGQVPHAMDEALELARFALLHGGGEYLRNLAEIAELPTGPFTEGPDLESARHVYISLAQFLLKQDGALCRDVNRNNGFPPDRKPEKERMLALLHGLDAIPGLAAALDRTRRAPLHYTEDEWRIVRACFTVLRHASGELRTVFAEAGSVDFVEVAQIAQLVLRGADGLPSESALAAADGIRHLLVDEFQDTSRRQHQLLSSLVAAWPDTAGRSVFVVGDPMQSIYFFRDAEVELFQRIRTAGLESSDGASLLFTPADLTANFRTAPELVDELNTFFARIHEDDDSSGITFTKAEPARAPASDSAQRLCLHLAFEPQSARAASTNQCDTAAQCEEACTAQTAEIVGLIRGYGARIEQAVNAGKKFRIAVLARTHTSLAPIAEALRREQIPFRAVDLESLKDRPEILDALALARALMNHQNRISWLGVLRAPWCGLSLEELHQIAATDAWSFPPPPVLQLLRERCQILSEDSRKAVDRLLDAVDSMPRLRGSLPTSATGTLLQQVWLALGGDSCVDATARANLDLFWTLLDKLPQGEQDLCGAALEAALEKLCALPDPAASGDYGVQLMTIHKSKGLEFEVVIVPDLHATTRRGSKRMLSWLERGLTNPDESGDVTEFLIAPMQPKGDDRGRAKEWVDHIHSGKESQETKRILYVAATRAREELHFFARPAYKRDRDGSLTLAKPSNSLLATAWPALEEEVKEGFEEWRSIAAPQEGEQPVIPAIAASGDSNLLVMPRPPLPNILRRLPGSFQPTATVASLVSSGDAVTGDSSKLYERHEGGLVSRALGNAVHRLLEEIARLRTTHAADSAIVALDACMPAITAQIRSAGIPASEAASIAAQAINQVRKAADHSVAQWILSPHIEAVSEAALAGVVNGGLRQVRIDRVFRAGSEPLLGGDDTWWIIDFKTAHTPDLDSLFGLQALRAAFAPQLETYANVLRNLHGSGAKLRAGLYYPQMSVLDWWEV